MLFRGFVLITVSLVTVAFAEAATIHVPADQPTVQAAIDAAVDGDTVLVAAGTYFEQINFSGKNITVRSARGRALTILDGSVGAGPVVRFVSGETTKAVLKGFTIQNGSLCCSYGGGGVEVANASPTIVNNLIRKNVGAGEGGGINVAFGSPLISGNVITGNTVAFFGGTSGGGISVRGASSARIIGNKITDNFGVGFGGGIGLFGADDVLVLNNTITANTAESQGGGLWIVNEANEVVVQNLIAKNSAPSGAQVYTSVPQSVRGFHLISNTIIGSARVTNATVIADGFNSNAQIINNIIFAPEGQTALLCNPVYRGGPPVVQFNDAVSEQGLAYDGMCAGLEGTEGNISADPAFMNAGRGNYRLRAGSPAIDAGDNAAPDVPPKDIARKPRIVDGDGDSTAIIDLGAYEFQLK